jgi:hypothetical protein
MNWLKQLNIRKYRAIESLDLEDLTQFCLILGANNSSAYWLKWRNERLEVHSYDYDKLLPLREGGLDLR